MKPLKLANQVGRRLSPGILEVAAVDHVLFEAWIQNGTGRRYVREACTVVRGGAETQVASQLIQDVIRVRDVAIDDAVAGNDAVAALHDRTVEKERRSQ